jgi:hypothetical protein
LGARKNNMGEDGVGGIWQARGRCGKYTRYEQESLKGKDLAIGESLC